MCMHDGCHLHRPANPICAAGMWRHKSFATSMASIKPEEAVLEHWCVRAIDSSPCFNDFFVRMHNLKRPVTDR